MTKRRMALGLALAFILLALTGCGGTGDSQEAPAALRFADSTDIGAIRALNGKTVSITGYMATLSPISGKYMYLMNMPYQSCPFCVPNTTQLANTMAVYAREGQTFAYTDQAIRVTGTLRLGDTVDDYGYMYGYRVENATYEIVDLSGVSEEYTLWRTIAEDGVAADINAMFNYLYFVCQWTEYQSSYTDENGMEVPFYLYPGDAEQYLADDGPYGYALYEAEDYFPGLIRRLRAISATELEDLVAVVEDAAEVARFARGELASGNYTYDEHTDRYTLAQDAQLYEEYSRCYLAFSQWLTKWEM